MSINPGLQLPYGIQPTNPVPVDAWSGPFTAGSFLEGISAANAAIAGAVRFQSMEVRLIVGGQAYKYWYGGGTGDGDLIATTTNINGVTNIISNDGRITIDASQGVSFNGPIYLTGDLIVTGRIVTSTGVFGATANALTEPVSDMIMDGGSF
jgi:hypothetical protein